MDNIIADDGETLHLRISGAGRPLILLHGWTSSHRDWNPFVEAFAEHFKVIRWDARGHGGHALQTNTLPTVQRMARDLHNLLEHHDLRDAVVAGHSMGALTLWQYVQDHGCARLGAAVIIDQSPRLVTDADWSLGIYGDFDAARNAGFIRQLREDFPEAVLRLVGHGLNAPARQAYDTDSDGVRMMRQRLARLAPQPLIDCWISLSAADYRPVLPTMNIPTLLVYGGASNFYTAATARYVAEHLPQATLHTYADVDHAPHLWRRERFIEDVQAFLGR